MDSSTPFATILVGQPTLRHSVKLGVLAALEQRITVRYQMKGMTPDETASYIRHHIEQAGRTAELFADDAIAQIHQAARGKPRTVNNICTAALIAAAGAGKNLLAHARRWRLMCCSDSTGAASLFLPGGRPPDPPMSAYCVYFAPIFGS